MTAERKSEPIAGTRRERRRIRHWLTRTPKKGQPATSECRCGVAFGALKTRDAIRARQQHELQVHRKGEPS